MIKVLPGVSGQFHNFKCGEVFCLAVNSYNVACCLCGVKLDFEEFCDHFQQHITPDDDNQTSSSTRETSKRLTRQSANQTIAATRVKVESDTEYFNDDPFDNHWDNNDDEPLISLQDPLAKIVVSSFEGAVAAADNNEKKFDSAKQNTGGGGGGGGRTTRRSQASKKDAEEIKKEASQQKDEELDLESLEIKRIAETGSNATAFFVDDEGDDDEIDIGIEDEEWLHEKYDYEGVLTDDEKFKDEIEAEGDINLDTLEREFNRMLESDNEDDYLLEQTRMPAESMMFSCEQCQKTFHSHLGLAAHKSHSHKKSRSSAPAVKKEYNCEECDEKFVSERLLQTHKYKHTGMACDVCGRKFTQVGNLERHKIRHTGVKNVKCKECDRTFFTDRECKAHMISHTGIMPYICDVCGKHCRDHGVLTQHMRRHTNERPAKCKVCGKGFFTGHDLNVHSVTHSKERPFSCDICGSTFQLKKSLRVHKKIHNKYRPFKCTICGKGFVAASGVASHMRVHGIDAFTKDGDAIIAAAAAAAAADNQSENDQEPSSSSSIQQHRQQQPQHHQPETVECETGESNAEFEEERKQTVVFQTSQLTQPDRIIVNIPGGNLGQYQPWNIDLYP